MNALPSSFLLAFLLSMTSHSMKYPFGQFGSVLLATSPPSLLPTSSLLAFGRGVGVERALMLWEHCSAVAKTVECSRDLLATATKHTTIRAAMGKVNSTPTRPHTHAKQNVHLK